MNFLNKIRNMCGPCCREAPVPYSHYARPSSTEIDPETIYGPVLPRIRAYYNVASPYDDHESKESSDRDSSDNDSVTAQHPAAAQPGPIGNTVTTRARVTYGLER